MADKPAVNKGSIKVQEFCSIEDCTRPHKGRGLCNMHLIRLRRHGDIQASIPGQTYVTTCQLDDCNRKPHAHGYCHSHLRRYYLYGDPEFVVTYPTICSTTDCQRKVVALGLCSRHYRQRKYRENPIADIVKVERRRARRKAVQRIEYGVAEVSARFFMFGNRCWICGSESNLTIDHVKPLALKGPDMPANLRPACRSCNSRKRDRWFGPFQLHRLIEK